VAELHQSVALIPGTSDYSPGVVRISFLVVDPRGRVVATPRARVWVARSLEAKPIAATTAQLEPIGVPGISTGADAKSIYVAHVRVPAAGRYQVVARPVGGKERIAGLGDLIVHTRSVSPMVGSPAYPSRTPTLADTGGRTALLTTRVPPDRGLPAHVGRGGARGRTSRSWSPSRRRDIARAVSADRSSTWSTRFASSTGTRGSVSFTSRFMRTTTRAKGQIALCSSGICPASRGPFWSDATAGSRRSSRGQVGMTEMGQAIRRLLL
jgi:hypothetical protein